MTAPCRGCPERTVEPNCHTDCPRYQAYRESRERIRAERDAMYHREFLNEAKDKAYRKKLNRYKRDH